MSAESFKIEIEIPETNPLLASYIIKHVLRGLALGCRPLFVGPDALPPLKETDVFYKEEKSLGSGVQQFRLPTYTLARGWADCGSLSVYELARKLATGEDPRADVTVADYHGLGNMHAQLREGSGAIKDYSVELGAKADWPDWFLYDLKE